MGDVGILAGSVRGSGALIERALLNAVEATQGRLDVLGAEAVQVRGRLTPVLVLDGVVELPAQLGDSLCLCLVGRLALQHPPDCAVAGCALQAEKALRAQWRVEQRPARPGGTAGRHGLLDVRRDRRVVLGHPRNSTTMHPKSTRTSELRGACFREAV